MILLQGVGEIFQDRLVVLYSCDPGNSRRVCIQVHHSVDGLNEDIGCNNICGCGGSKFFSCIEVFLLQKKNIMTINVQYVQHPNDVLMEQENAETDSECKFLQMMSENSWRVESVEVQFSGASLPLKKNTSLAHVPPT